MPKKIYVVDAAEEILSLFDQILSGEGYSVSVQAFPLRSLDQLRQAQPDLIILDYLVDQEEDGWQALELLKMSDDLRHIPIIVCAAPSRHLEEMYSYLKGKDVAVVLKPFDSDELVAAVNAAINDTPLQRTLNNPNRKNGQRRNA